jgi:hypothetical protein
MHLRNVLLSLAGISIAWSVAFADQTPVQQYAKSGISRMFLDAHSPDQPKYSRSDIKRMTHDAKTSEDFERLADYFDYRAMEFEQKTHEDLKELQRLLDLPYRAKSYPTQVDHVRELIRSDKAQEKDCSARANAYREQAGTSTATK